MGFVERLASTEVQLQRIVQNHPDAVFAHSYGAEDMVLLDIIARLDLPLSAFSLDTGRLPEETYALMQTVQARYFVPVTLFFPKAEQIEAYSQQYGINGFYRGVEERKACCQIRKLNPLKRALQGRSAWITGLRRAQSPTRTAMESSEYDTSYHLQKFSPLLEWTESDVWHYIQLHKVPYNALHDRHYPSIGCAPCTRAIAVGEDIRAGRWWWEQSDTKECGLHSQ